MLITVGTGRTGDDIASAICKSIENQNPEHIVFLTTVKSSTKTMPYIKENPIVSQKEIEEIKLSDPDDVERIVTECNEKVKNLINKGITPDMIVADYTSGTKAMSAGLSIAAIENRLRSIIYVTGERGPDGRVISGTERFITLQPNRIFGESLLGDAIDMFNTYQFDSCIQLLSSAKEIYRVPELMERFEFMESLAMAYQLWDRFYLTESYNKLREIKKSPFLKSYRISKQVHKNMEILNREIEDVFSSERMADLYENARRRGEVEKKFDDAVARLYRLCEYIAQFELNRYGLYLPEYFKKESVLAINYNALNPSLRDKYQKYAQNGKLIMGLKASYELLNDLGDEVGDMFLKNTILSRKLLGLRNKSILAHGFNPISENVFKDMYYEIGDLLKQMVPDFEEIQDRVCFPHINTIKG